ncbi:UDP-2,4-diacetamido-2,4,6-trideoxy-beta-L-altropyranose hydrolase [Chelativorans sp. ZYF759]|uniref:UDP-2,4-diacetamido-2,4, 6-trideoxy-beta-L-altropyranose hydrolase n=1 Tax=Chelativorans sp. ZYF759 TaxID=2692213 RepID=UPI00145F8453|nr:UDP-2,4-diacetamido-2,4,6-trideoxy-beta-L-altropyranose hydrolase [Chelativorans sp. ZYF759]NMG42022.1 UDP-2,4-diacetamido-2,4,6-trideoxy-beta-L-altropyranose hydrolase [Chelativorans sp. ZYF759]
MRVLIRADGSSEIGLGHLVRCRTLARSLVAKGANITFAARMLPDQQSAMLAADGFDVISLPGDADGDERRDAEETLAAARGGTFDWGIVDSYSLGREWEATASQFCRGLLAIDDFGKRPHQCDILLDQNYRSTKDHVGTAPPDVARQLLGPKYALVDESYLKVTPRMRMAAARALVFFGGADAPNLTALALEALSDPELAGVELDIVVGAANVHAAAIDAKVKRRGNATVHGMQPSLAPLMDLADFAVGAGGSTNWERLYCGLPSLVASVADNQVPVCQALAADDLIAYVGPGQELCAAELASRIKGLMGDGERFASMSQRGMAVVDGLGARRVAEIIAPSAPSGYRLRSASRRDCLLYFTWANEPATRRNSLSGDEITWADHEIWFGAKLKSTSCLFVLETSLGLPVGQIRFDTADGAEFRLSFSVDQFMRGRGIGTSLVALGLERMKARAQSIVAEVRTENEASARVFRRLGFQHVGRHDDVDRFRIAIN